MSSVGIENLRHFLLREMRMSHIYQPLMIRTMLLRGGHATTREIAAAILAEDESQLDYFQAQRASRRSATMPSRSRRQGAFSISSGLQAEVVVQRPKIRFIK
jgi:hypothetical protein